MTEEQKHTTIPLTDEQIDNIAERAAERALEMVYAEVGKSVLRKILWVVGAAGLAVWLWFKDGKVHG